MPGMDKAPATLRAAQAIALELPADAAADGQPLAPEWVQLIPAGSFSGRDGRGPYLLDGASVLAAFERGGIDLPIDYEHQTLEAAAKAGPVPAAGWIKALEVREGSLWGRAAWTPKAADLIAQREYRFLSPVFRHDKAGRIVALEGAGLTHYPNLELTPVAHRTAAPSQTEGVSSMSDLHAVAAALGAPADADAAALAAHAAHLKAELEAARSAGRAAPDPREWVPMSQHKAVAEELAALQKQVAKEKAEAAVRAAMSAGKLAPAMQAWATAYAEKDPEGFAEWVKAAPAILPPEGGKAAHRVASNADTLTDEDRYVCAALGLSEADFAAHKKTLIKE